MDRQSGSDHGEGAEPGRDPRLPDGTPEDRPVPDPAPAPGASPLPPADPMPPGAPGAAPAPDPGLAGFASGGQWNACPASAALAVAAEAVSGPEWRCPSASDDQLAGVLGRWAALEAWAAAGRLGVTREMIRREAPPHAGGNRHGDLPDQWLESLGHELAAALGISVQSADASALLAWDLQARLPGIGGALADGRLSFVKVMLIVKELSVLSEDDAAKAEAMILDQLVQTPELTPSQLARLAAQAAVTIDPGGAQRRREAAEQLDVRVRLWREQSGAAAIAGRNLPTDEALAAYASVNARTAQYKKSKAFPDASMDQLRAMAYLDLLNGIAADDRIASARAKAAAPAQASNPAPAQSAPAQPDPSPPTPAGPDPAAPGQDRPPAASGDPSGGDPSGGACRECDGSCVPVPDEDDYDAEENPDDDSRDNDPDDNDPDDNDPDEDGPDEDGPDEIGPDGDGPDDGCPGGSGSGGAGPPGGCPGSTSPGDPGQYRSGPEDDSPRGDPAASRSPADYPEPPKLADLVIPLLTLLGLAERPGEGHGLGPLDPALCRDLAATASSSLRTQWCVTLTDSDGFAIGHGCARLARGDKATWKPWLNRPATQQDRLAALPSQVNLTIPATALPALAALARPGSPPGRDAPETAEPGTAWAFTPRDSTGMPETGPPDGNGYGTWTLTLPGGRNLTVAIEPVPTHECDHRNESHGYEPSDTLRHLVQIRDGSCTFPPCSRHAKETDFEHALPYHKGGRTCACNAGARSRKCHRIKQSPGWNVTQPKPGWHQWTTPSGRVYTQEPKRYPS